MENIVRAAFPKIDGPLIEPKNNNGCFHTYINTTIDIQEEGQPNSRNFNIGQEMTWLGRSYGQMTQSTDIFEGINDKLVRETGQLNPDVIDRTLKMQAGVVSNVTMNDIIAPEVKPWHDNQVALLYNLMRFAIMRRLGEGNCEIRSREYFYGHLPVYMDGHIRIDSNKIFDESEYPKHGLESWPGGLERENYPEYRHLWVAHAPFDGDAIDCRRLTIEETRIVLMCAARWKRRSRFRMDHDLDKLTDVLYYRTDNNWQINVDWQEPRSAENRKVGVTKLPASHKVWDALITYVQTNRLHKAFSVAAYIMSAVMCQMRPPTAEGQAWLGLEMQVHLPKFWSCRGRYTFMNEGKPCDMSDRARADWIYIGEDMGRLITLGIVSAQAFGFGLGIRTSRMYTEADPEDLYETERFFDNDETFYASAIAEALRIEVLTSGHSAAYVTMNKWTMYKFDEPIEIEGYSADRDAAPEGYNVRWANDGTGKLTLLVDRYVLPGLPVFHFPLKPEATPGIQCFSFRGSLGPDDGDYNLRRRGWEADYRKVYDWAVISRIAGWDVSLGERMRFDGPNRFFAPNENSWSWPLAIKEDYIDMPVSIINMTERGHKFASVPYIHNKTYARKMEWRMYVKYGGTSREKMVSGGNPVLIETSEYPVQARDVLAEYAQKDPFERHDKYPFEYAVVRESTKMRREPRIVFNVVPSQWSDLYWSNIEEARDMRGINPDSLPHKA